MATLQKFKLLAIQCGVLQSPTRSPRMSPVVQFRRRKSTLRKLLTRTTSRKFRRGISDRPSSVHDLSPEKKSESRKLKDLFGSSLPFGEEEEDKSEAVKEEIESKSEVVAAKLKRLEVESGSPRTGWVGFRHRLLLRGAWRPMLMPIPE